MAFDVRRWAHISESYNTGALTTTINPSATPVVVNAPGLFTYASASDTIATIAGANYFADQVDNLAVGDIIMAKGSDATGAYQVATVDRDAGTITVTDWEIAGAVDTANIVDGAVTNAKVNAAAAIAFSKLAALSSGNILVGSAGNVATSVAMSGDITISNTGVTAIGAAKVTSAMLAIDTIRHVQVAVSAAEWNGMYATPKELIAAPGAGKAIVVDTMLFTMTFVAAQYANGGLLVPQYGTTINGGGLAAAGTLAAATINGLAASSAFQLRGAQAAAAITGSQNQALCLSNQTAAFTTGDGTWKIDIWYRVVTI